MTHVEESKSLVENNERLLNLTLDLVNKSGLAWSIEKEPLVSPSGRTTDNYGLFRSDNGYCVGIHKSRYVPCDNHELARLMVYASSVIDDLNIDDAKGGLFKGGAKVYMQIPLPMVQIGNAQVVRHLTALNSHDGSTSVALGTTQTVVTCQNTFYKAHRSQGMERVLHSKNMIDRLNQISNALQMTIVNDMLVVEKFRKMHQQQTSSRIVEGLKDLVFNVDSSKDDLELSTRKTNLMSKFEKCVSIEYGQQGENLWGLFNAVTRYTNHEMKANYKTNNTLEHVMVGQGARINQAAYSYLSQFAN